MLHGSRVTLRLIREADLDAFAAAHADIRNRGAFFPLGVVPASRLRAEFAENGFWQREEGTLLITTPTASWPATSSSSSRSATETRSSSATCSTTTASPGAAT